MSIVHFPSCHQNWFWALAILWSFFQAYAGYSYGVFIHDNAFKDLHANSFRSTPKFLSRICEWLKQRCGDIYPWLKRTFAYGFHHGALYFICCLFGFVAWRIADEVSPKTGNSDWSTLTNGTATFLIALAYSPLLAFPARYREFFT